jgi:hypothetical protein
MAERQGPSLRTVPRDSHSRAARTPGRVRAGHVTGCLTRTVRRQGSNSRVARARTATSARARRAAHPVDRDRRVISRSRRRRTRCRDGRPRCRLVRETATRSKAACTRDSSSGSHHASCVLCEAPARKPNAATARARRLYGCTSTFGRVRRERWASVQRRRRLPAAVSRRLRLTGSYTGATRRALTGSLATGSTNA